MSKTKSLPSPQCEKSAGTPNSHFEKNGAGKALPSRLCGWVRLLTEIRVVVLITHRYRRDPFLVRGSTGCTPKASGTKTHQRPPSGAGMLGTVLTHTLLSH